MCLRVEDPNRSAGEEYRIRDGQVQVRSLHQAKEDDGWHRLTAEQLADHVNRNSVVAQWLKHRLGWRRLLRACVAEQYLHDFGIKNGEHGRRQAAPKAGSTSHAMSFPLLSSR
jgi:hypothetical protein